MMNMPFSNRKQRISQHKQNLPYNKLKNSSPHYFPAFSWLSGLFCIPCPRFEERPFFRPVTYFETMRNPLHTKANIHPGFKETALACLRAMFLALCGMMLWPQCLQSETIASADSTATHYLQIIRQYDENLPSSKKFNCAEASLRIGDIYFQKEGYSQALNFYFLGLQICEENHFNELLTLFYKNIGNIYSTFGDNKLAIDYYEKGLALARKNNYHELELRLLINLCGIYIYDGNLTRAKEYHQRMMQCDTTGNPLVPYFGYLSSALIMNAEGQQDEAIDRLHKAGTYARQQNLGSQFIAAAYAELSNIYEQMQQPDSVLHYCLLNLQLARQEKLSSIELKNLRALYELYKEKGNSTKSSYYREKYLNLADSVMNAAEYNKIKNLYLVYEFDKNHKEIARLTEDSLQKANQIGKQRIILAFTFACLLIFITMLWLVSIQKKKLTEAYKSLFQRNKDIIHAEQANEAEKDTYEQRINQLETENEQLLQRINREATNNMAPAGNEAKYSSNKMSNEQRDIILHRINKVARNPEIYCDNNFSLEHLSTLVGSNSRYVSQIINETLGKNFRTFTNELRINEAQRRLLDTQNYGNQTIRAIGESVGYKSQANFIDAFRKQTGMTPSIYQKMAQEKLEGTEPQKETIHKD